MHSLSKENYEKHIWGDYTFKHLKALKTTKVK